MRERDAVAVITILVFLGGLLAIIVGLRIVNNWVYISRVPLISSVQ
jgi:hypothetical protein